MLTYNRTGDDGKAYTLYTDDNVVPDDVVEDFVAQHCHDDSTVANFWGTVVVKVRPSADIAKIVAALRQFEMTISDDLA